VFGRIGYGVGLHRRLSLRGFAIVARGRRPRRALSC
jgi:hypothetical protein